MNRITWYVFRQLTVSFFLVAIVLTMIIWLSQSLRLIEMIVEQGASAGTFVYLSLLLLPNFFTFILPITLFIVVVFIYSKLITDRELVVMRAAGLTQIQLAKPAFVLGGVVLLLTYSINMYFLPLSYQKFGELKWDIRSISTHALLRAGTFNQVSKGITVYVRERNKEGHLLGVFVHDERQPDKSYTVMAEKGTMVESEGSTRVHMFNGSRHSIDKKTNAFSILEFDRYAFDLSKDPQEQGIRAPEAREMYIGELLNLDDKSNVRKKDYGKYTVEGHRRIVSPLSTIGYMLVGLACLISGAFTRRNQTRRISLAVAIVVFLQISSMALENSVARNLN